MKIIFGLLFILLCCGSCQWLGNTPSFGDDYITYKISKGNHEIDNNSNGLFTGNEMKFQAIFDSTCIYKTVDPGNQFDINKLMGFRIAARNITKTVPVLDGTGKKMPYISMLIFM